MYIKQTNKKMQIISDIKINHSLENNPSCSQLRRILPVHFDIVHWKSHCVQLAPQHNQELSIPQILRRQLHNSRLYLAIFLKSSNIHTPNTCGFYHLEWKTTSKMETTFRVLLPQLIAESAVKILGTCR